MKRVFSLFHPKKLQSAWEFNPGALVWRIFFTSTNRIIGETRDQNKKSVSFFCLDAQSGVPLWKDFVLDEPWWTGIEAVHRDVVILHEFARPDMPEHKSFSVIDIESGKLLWKNQELSFWFAYENKLYAQKYLFEKRVGYSFDLHNGTVVEEFSDNLEPLDAMRHSASEQGIDRELVFPEPFNANETDAAIANEIKQVSERKLDHTEYLLHRGILFVSYYEPEFLENNLPMFSNTLAMIDMKKHKILFKEVLTKKAQAPAPDSFLVKGDCVYFIKDQLTLTALKPWMS